MKIDHFEIHLERFECYIHKRTERDGGDYLWFRNRRLKGIPGHGAFSTDRKSIQNFQICMIFHTLQIPVPDVAKQEDQVINKIKSDINKDRPEQE